MDNEKTVYVYHYSWEYNDCEYHTKNIAEFHNLPEHFAVMSSFMERVSMLSGGNIIIHVTELPARIDYDKYMDNLYILSKEEAAHYPSPKELIHQGLSVTLWEYGERELTNLEEVGELQF